MTYILHYIYIYICIYKLGRKNVQKYGNEVKKKEKGSLKRGVPPGGRSPAAEVVSLG